MPIFVLSEALEYFYQCLLLKEEMQSQLNALKQVLNKKRKSVENKLAALEDDLKAIGDADDLRIKGELLLSNLPKIGRGQTEVEVENYYDPNLSKMVIFLEPRFSPSENAQRYFKLYNKAKRGKSVIYNLIDDVTKALKGMLEPTIVEVIQGRAEVRAVFSAGKRSKVAGIYVTEGRINRGAHVRVLRQGEVIHDSIISSLKRFKDDVREVATGFEGGAGVQGFDNFEVGDILESYRIEGVA